MQAHGSPTRRPFRPPSNHSSSSSYSLSQQVIFLNLSTAYTRMDQPNYILMTACSSQDNYTITTKNVGGDKLGSLIQEVGGNVFTDHTTLDAMVFRVCLSASSNVFDTFPTEGNFYSESVGWHPGPPTMYLELIPGTTVATLTIFTALCWGSKGRATGGFNNVFLGIKEQDIRRRRT
ncbi:hypothetical protein DFH08DRAFT_821831 [Mycena albidolilacea]|uniref:Uncharacterized protein n=1 Tax=Mycena albidolilacea TaxID=1033008 RepID=A0AAD6Z9T9_9AGAR|nr:hypothetical protein DFH08DRAFT_821831 [Mycena albidolilacea]